MSLANVPIKAEAPTESLDEHDMFFDEAEPNTHSTLDTHESEHSFQYNVKDEYPDESNYQTETVEDLLARAEQIVIQNQALIEQTRSEPDFASLVLCMDTSASDGDMTAMLEDTLANADLVLHTARRVQIESAIARFDPGPDENVDLSTPTPDNSVMEVIELTNDDDDDVIFVAQIDPPNHTPIIVDLSVDSPIPAARPVTPYDEIQNQVVDFVLDHTDRPSTSNSRRRNREFNPIVQVMAQQMEESAVASAALAAATAATNAEAAARLVEAESSPKRSRVESANNKQINCAVCLEPPFDNRPTATTCGHVFCYSCIHQAIKTYKRCPMCQKKITAKQVHMLYI